MKNIIKMSIVVVVISGLAQAQEMKKYEVKSAKIEYEIKGSGNMMGGMVKIKSVGKKRLVFDNYGLKELNEENKVTKNTTMGTTKVDKVHVLNYMNGAIVYGVDFKQKRINRMENPMSGLASLFGGKSATKTGEEMLKKMGGKKIGTDKVAGQTCDIWKLSGVTQCIYKGIPLKIESNIMGLKSVEVATKAEFDLTLKKDAFKLPDYSIYGTQSPKPLDKSKLEAMDKKANAKIKGESKEAKKGLEAMGKGFEAAVKAGYDLKSGKEMTPAQEAAMRKGMMSAMGGEDVMLKEMKNEILEDIKEIPKAKKCFQNADTLKEANACERIFDAEEPEIHSKWNSKIKADLLKEIDGASVIESCVKNAKTMDEFGTCFPKDR